MTREGIYPHVDFGNRIVAFFDFLHRRRTPYDDNGHGTHVAGILGGSGRASQGKYRGVAPECGIVSLKVLDQYGNGSKEDVLRAFQWILGHGELYGVRVVNISVGASYGAGWEVASLIQGAEQLWDRGYVVVAAAGNQGPRAGSITAPGSSKKVITVGASDLLDGKSGVSGRGPTWECVCKPDIVTPGGGIVSCVPGPGNGYGVKSGTSMSTPVISGAVACALEKDGSLTNKEIKMRLKESARDLGLPKNLQGWGLFDLNRFLSL
ncbi:MAG: S8 family peptidase [Eubacteriales bacterium]|nr:S8 family peptidase [Eubacteriales bacterium]